jgi:CRISP-associated protein Cas1
MKHHLNTLFVTTQGAYLRKEGEAVAVRIAKKTKLRVPFINLGSIACMGRVACSTPLLAACAATGISVAYLTEHGRFLAVVHGYSRGNVLLRREQYRRADDLTTSAQIARNVILGKLSNYRAVLRRAARESKDNASAETITKSANRIDRFIQLLPTTTLLDSLRGIEGEASATYFSVFNSLITSQRNDFYFSTRTRRPPLDAVNALLSFLYSMLAGDARSACEAVGLDAAVGFLHRDRPGRPSLGLDLMEELRPILADRLAISLINRQQVRASGFEREANGAVLMDDATRKVVIAAYQKRKQESMVHPFLQEKVSLGLVIHLQARLLARHLRGDIDAYPPCVWK